MAKDIQIVLNIANIVIACATIYMSITGIRSARAARKALEQKRITRKPTTAKQDGRLTEVVQAGDLTITDHGQLNEVES